MAKKVRINWNVPAFEEIMRLPAIADAVKGSADRIAEGCGDGFVAEAGDGLVRARAAVIAVTPKARIKNARNNTIIRNVDRGRL